MDGAGRHGRIHLLELAGEAKPKERTLQIARRSIASINDMVTDLLEYTRTRLGRGIELPVDVVLMFDAPRMRQVLTNLLGNAVQHGDPAHPVALAIRDEGAHVTPIVKNQGRPIPPDSMQVIFNPLVQVATRESAPHERPATSLGLGLYIAREIVTGHGGTITLTSSAAEGTAFTVHLPRGGKRASQPGT